MENNQEKGVTLVDISKEMRGAYLQYSMSVIVGRALPDVRDGLKPVHRRVQSVIEIDECAGLPKLLLKLIPGDDPAGHTKQDFQDLPGLSVKPQTNAVLA